MAKWRDLHPMFKMTGLSGEKNVNDAMARGSAIESSELILMNSHSRRFDLRLGKMAVSRGLRFVAVAALFQIFPSVVLLANGQNSESVPISRMKEVGEEGKALENSVGEWDVVFSLWASPGAEPAVTKGLIAERKMVGLYQEEIMRPGPEAKMADFRRVAYLTFSRVEGRWQYVSLDTRFPVGLMPAYSFGKGKSGQPLELIFEPIAFPGMGEEVEGHMMRSNLVITRESADRELIQQYFIASDGSEREWLAVQYEYTRRK